MAALGAGAGAPDVPDVPDVLPRAMSRERTAALISSCYDRSSAFAIVVVVVVVVPFPDRERRDARAAVEPGDEERRRSVGDLVRLDPEPRLPLPRRNCDNQRRRDSEISSEEHTSELQ